MHSIAIELVPGDVAPRYNAQPLELVRAVITEQGTKERLPIVDLVFRGPNGETFVASTTGRIFNGVAQALAGVNLRNHGTATP